MPNKAPTHNLNRTKAKLHRPRDDQFYSGARWRKLRRMALRRMPLCVDPFGYHSTDNESVPATDIDHITPRRQSPAMAYDLANLQSLCKSCHSRKTRTESDG